MVDISSSQLRPDIVWRALGRNLATGAGALTALLSLVSGSTVSTACIRGAAALFGVLFLTRIGTAALRGIDAMEERTNKERPRQPDEAATRDQNTR
jgi:hypothetical protein